MLGEFGVLYNKYIEKLIECKKKIQVIQGCEMRLIDKGFHLILDLFQRYKINQDTLFFVGNGGSAAIASHMTADFMKNGGLKTYSLYDNAVTTCMGNDYGYEFVFSKPLDFLLKENDLLVAISSSGNSQNIINAISVAKDKGANVITFTGFREDNQVKQMGDINVWVPCEEYGIVESIHNLLLQQIVDTITERDGVSI